MITEYDLRRATQEDIVLDEFTIKRLLNVLRQASIIFKVTPIKQHDIDFVIAVLGTVKNKPAEILETIRILQNYSNGKAGYNHATPKKAVDELIAYLEIK
jgi:endonuclease III